MTTTISGSTGIVVPTSDLANIQSINGGPISGLRNPVTNYGFQIDTRNEGASQNITTSLAKCFDNWVVTAGAAVSGSLQVGQAAGEDGVTQSSNAFTFSRTSGTYSGDLRMYHEIPTADCHK